MKNKPDHLNRIKEVRKYLTENNIDGLLIERWENYFYLTGFMEEEAYCLVTHANVYLLVDARYLEQAANDCPHCRIIEHFNNSDVILFDCIKADRISVLALDQSHISHLSYMKYKEQFKEIDLVWSDGGIYEIRMCKDDYETEQISRAQKITDHAFAQILPMLKPGVTEIDIAAELEYIMKKNGAMKPSFDTIAVSGSRTSLPHGKPTDKKIRCGDPVTMDFGCIVNGYCSDMTRTVFVGEVTDQMKEIYGIVLSAQKAAIESAKQGITNHEVDEAARNIIAQAGYGECFGHGTGHGIGIEIHEAPRVSLRGKKIKLRNGMAVTVEPGIYLPGVGGVRIEDDIIIKGDKPVNITRSPKELLVL